MKKIIFAIFALAFIGLSTTYGQVGVGTNSPDASAALEVQSTEKGFLPPRMSTLERNAIESPAEGLVIYNTDLNSLEFYNSEDWISAIDGEIVSSPVVESGACQGAFEEILHNNLIYKPVESNGKCWLDRNLGATQVATASNDAASYGDLYQWGRAADGHEKRNSQTFDGTSTRPNTIIQNGAWDGLFISIPSGTNRNDWVTTQSNDAWNNGTQTNPEKTITDPCPSRYRIPTQAEWQDEINQGNLANISDAISSPLKLPAAGLRNSTNGSISSAGTFGGYWSSTTSSNNASRLGFTSSGSSMFAFNRSSGYSVRCLKD
jgi:uncharacterized protein (TIGR02145 family)